MLIVGGNCDYDKDNNLTFLYNLKMDVSWLLNCFSFKETEAEINLQ